MVEADGKEGAPLYVAEHQQGNQRHPGDDQQGEEAGLFARLRDRGREVQVRQVAESFLTNSISLNICFSSRCLP